MQLVVPVREHLSGYVAALRQDWSGDTIDTVKTARAELMEIEADADAFLTRMTDREPRDTFVTLPDGSQRLRLPSIKRWMWDDGFCGSINFRWQNGTAELPPDVLGHIGYSTVPWRCGKGYAKEALRLMLLEAKREGLPYVELTTQPENLASQRVILANGGILVESFRKSPAHGGSVSFRYRISLLP